MTIANLVQEPPFAWDEADALRSETASTRAEAERLREQVRDLTARLHRGDEQRRALLHIVNDLQLLNTRLGRQRKAMIHILADYEQDRRRLGLQAGRLDGSRRALLHILQDSHESNLRLERSRKAMIHIMGDLRETTEEVQRREHELRDKQEQLIQAGKLATLGELTTGVAHELNNPLNNIGLFLGNVIDFIQHGQLDKERIMHDLRTAMQQVRKATEIISHLRTFGRSAVFSREIVSISVGMSKISWLTCASWRGSPLTFVVRCILPTSFTSSAVRRHGPIGQYPSRLLPRNHWRCRFWSVRAETSFTMV